MRPDTVTAHSSDPCEAAIGIAKSYLRAMEERDLDRAAAFVHATASFIFPGGVRREGIAEIVKGSASRYQFVGKTIDGCDAIATADGGVNVYVRGTLHGRWLDGRRFEGIRFVDRFEISGGKIRRQEVWNDAGEIRNQAATT
jgi:hypothetical protein